MLVSSVIIVLREVLEAALLLSVLLVLSRRMQIRPTWLLAAGLLGIGGAVAYAQLIGPVSELFEGVGQELTNAALQFGVFLALVPILFLVARHRGHTAKPTELLPSLMALTVALAVSREGSEIIIFVSGFLQMESLAMSVLLGSLAGAAIGFSVGILLYYLLLAVPAGNSTWISLILLSLAGSSMCTQATKLLIQADWVAAAGPLWDSSAIVTEQSVPGQLLYALIGYEASPTMPEVAAYAGSIVVLGLCAILGWTVFTSTGEDA